MRRFGSRGVLASVMCAAVLLCGVPAARAVQDSGVEPVLVGIWEIPVPGGRWVWTIHGDGTYDFRNESPTFAFPHNGTMTAHGGRWSIQATNGYSDSGTYEARSLPGAFIATGKLGRGEWHHPVTRNPTPGPGPSQAIRQSPNPGPGPAIGGRGGGIFNCNPCNGPIAK